MDGHRFDEWTKAMATGRSRRDMVRAVAGVAIGGLLAGIGRGVLAAPGERGGNRACAHFCAAAFGEDTPEAGACTSACARGEEGLFEACGGDTARLCPTDSGPVCCSATGVCFYPQGTGLPGVCVECAGEDEAEFRCGTTSGAVCIACGGTVEMVDPSIVNPECICHID